MTFGSPNVPNIVRDYGANGNGSADNSTPIQNAINDLPSVGGMMEIPVGLFKCNTGLTLGAKTGVRFVGQGGMTYNESSPWFGSCLIAGTAGMTLLSQDAAGGINQSGVTISNVNLIDNVGSTTTLLKIADTNHWSLSRVGFHGHSDLTCVGLVQTAGGSSDNSWSQMTDCHTYRAQWQLTSGFGIDITGGSAIGNIVNTVDIGPTQAHVRIIGFKGDNGNPCIRMRGADCQVIGFNHEMSGGTTNTKAIQVDGTASGISGQRNQIIGCSVSGGGGAGHYGVEITANATNTVLTGLSTSNFISGQGIVDNGVNTSGMRGDQGTSTVPFMVMGDMKQYRDTAAPTTLVHARSEIVWNSTPSELGTAASKYVVLGWICTVAGTPGTWLPMRVLTGN